MNHITSIGRIVAEIPKPMKRRFAKAITEDRLTIKQAMLRLVQLYLEGKVSISNDSKFDF